MPMRLRIPRMMELRKTLTAVSVTAASALVSGIALAKPDAALPSPLAGVLELQSADLHDSGHARAAISRMYAGTQSAEMALLVSNVAMNRLLVDTTIDGPAKRALLSAVQEGFDAQAKRLDDRFAAVNREILDHSSPGAGVPQRSARAIQLNGAVNICHELTPALGSVLAQMGMEGRAIPGVFAAHQSWMSQHVSDPAVLQAIEKEKWGVPWLIPPDPNIIWSRFNDPTYGMTMRDAFQSMALQFNQRAWDFGEVFWGSVKSLNVFSTQSGARDSYGLAQLGFFIGLFIVAPWLSRRRKTNETKPQQDAARQELDAARGALQAVRTENAKGKPNIVALHDLDEVSRRYEAAVTTLVGTDVPSKGSRWRQLVGDRQTWMGRGKTMIRYYLPWTVGLTAIGALGAATIHTYQSPHIAMVHSALTTMDLSATGEMLQNLSAKLNQKP